MAGPARRGPARRRQHRRDDAGWVCFDHLPEDIANNAYAGLVVKGERLFHERALMDGGFEVIVSGHRKGVGSSRETAVQAEKWSGIRIAIAASFAPIHARNNVNQGVLMGDHAMLARLQTGEADPARGVHARSWDPITQLVIEHGGLFPFYEALARGEVKLPARDAGAAADDDGREDPRRAPRGRARARRS